jgi:prepilin-type N-terminal cleavage/methylation domain-containing protein/prepilin-type processing-associated H-X9-DG protein
MVTGYRKNKAFTLIELLVVISIIALLLSILTPSLAKVKRQVATTICATRFKDIGNALGMYLIDYKGKMPPSYLTSPFEAEQYALGNIDVIWMSRISAYYDKQAWGSLSQTVYDMEVFRCPTQEYYLKSLQQHGNGAMITSPKTGREVMLIPGPGTFGYNFYFSGLWGYTAQLNPSAGNAGEATGFNEYNYRRSDVIKNTSNLPMVGDLAAEPFYGYRVGPEPPESAAGKLGGWLMWPSDPHPIAQNHGWRGGWFEYGPAALHDGKINYLFADGHAEARKMWPWDNVDPSNGAGAAYHYFHPLGK